MDEQNLRPPAGRRRDKTRARICAAAREVFLNSGFDAATIDEIANAAGTRRSTIYNYFSDKNQLLAAIADDYMLAVTAVIDTLPGPIPSRAQIDSWLRDFTDLVLRERVPTLLLVNFSRTQKVPPAAEAFGLRLIEAFAKRLPAFAQALRPDPGIAMARAIVVLRELGCALCYHMEHGGEGLSPYLLRSRQACCNSSSRVVSDGVQPGIGCGARAPIFAGRQEKVLSRLPSVRVVRHKHRA